MANPGPAHSSGARMLGGIVVATVIAAVAGAAFAVGIAPRESDAGATSEPTAPTASASSGPPNTADLPAQPIPVAPAEPVTFTFAAAGDVLPHGPVMSSARKGDGYDFGPMFEPSSAFVSGPDIAICHLEVPIAPKGTAPSGYPMFGAPAAIVPDLAEAGWDGCSTASNHSVDRGFAGIESTLDAFDKADLSHSGTARSEQEAAQVQFYNVVKGDRTVKVASISFTYGLNGLPKPAGKPWAVNTFDASAANVKPILDAARDARDKGADVVISSVHCCVEYNTQPSSTQKSIVAQIAESGLVDLYVGHHAHVPQPISLIDGGPSGDGMWAAYGLGNFVSNQDASTVGHQETANGEIVQATFTVAADGTVSVDVGWTAVTVDRTGGHVIYPITKDTGAVGGISASSVRARWQLVADAVGSEATEITEPAEALADFVWRNTRTP